MPYDNINDPWRNEEEQPDIRPAPPPAQNQQQNLPVPRAAAVPQPAQRPAQVQQPMEMDARQWQRVLNDELDSATLESDTGRNPDSDVFAQIWALPEETEEWKKSEKERILTDPAYRERQQAIDQTLGMLKDISSKFTREVADNFGDNSAEDLRWRPRDPKSRLDINPDIVARMLRSQRFREDTSEQGQDMLAAFQNSVQREWEAWRGDRPGLGTVAWDSMQRGLNMSRDLLGAANDFFAGSFGNISDDEAKYRAEMRGRRQLYESGFQGGERQQSFWAFFDKDQDKGLRDFAEYVVESVGEQMGIMALIQIGTWMAEGIAAAFTGGASIPATEAIRQSAMGALKQGAKQTIKAASKGAVEAAAKQGGESAAKALIKSQAIRRAAAATGGAAMDYLINTGDTMDTLAREALERNEDIHYGVGALESIAKTAIDYPAGFVRIARNNPLKFMRGSQMKIAYTATGRELWRDIWRGTKEALVDSLGEGAQEMAQKLVDRAGNRYLYGTWLLDGEKDGTEAFKNDMEEGMAGLVAGAAFSAPGQFGKIKRERKEIRENREESRKIFNSDAGAPVTRFLRDAIGNADFEALSANDQAMLLAAVRALAQKNVGTRRTKITAAELMKEGETDPMKANALAAEQQAQGGYAEALYGERLDQLRKDMSDAGRAWFDAYCQGYGQSTFKDYDAAVASATDEQRAAWKSDVDLGALRRNEMKARQVGKVRLENPGDSILFDDSPKGDGKGGHVWIRGYVADSGEVYWTVGRSDGGAMPMFEGEEISSKDFSGTAEQQYYASLGAAIQFADKLGGWARWNDATADDALLKYAQGLVQKQDEETGRPAGKYAGRRVVIVRNRRDLENKIDQKTGRPEAEDLSDDAKETMFGTGPTGLSNNWEGYTEKGTIYINRSKVSSPLDLAAILDHETFHDSLDKMANDSGVKLELKQKLGIGDDVSPSERRAYTAAYLLGIDLKGRALDIDTIKDLVKRAEETMAVDAEGARRVGLDKEGGIRHFLREMPVLSRLLPKYIAGKFGIRPESEEQIGDFLYNVITKGSENVNGSVVFGRRPNGVDGTNGIKDRKTMLEHIKYDSQQKAAQSGLGDMFGRIFGGGEGGGKTGGAAPAASPSGPRAQSGGTGGAAKPPSTKTPKTKQAPSPAKQISERATNVRAVSIHATQEAAERAAKESGGRQKVWQNGDGTFSVVWNRDHAALVEDRQMAESQAKESGGTVPPRRSVGLKEGKPAPAKKETKPVASKPAAEKPAAPKKEPAKKPAAEKPAKTEPVKTEPIEPEKPTESKPEEPKAETPAKPSTTSKKLPPASNKGKPPVLRTLMPNAKAATKKMLDWLQRGTYSPGTYGKTPVRMLPIKFRAKNGSVVERPVVVRDGTPYILLDMGGIAVPWYLNNAKTQWLPAIEGADSAKIGDKQILGSRSMHFVSQALMQEIGNGFAVIRGDDFKDCQTGKGETLDAVKMLDAETGRKAIEAFTTKENDAADPKTKPDKLAQMAKSSDDAVRLAVATNPSSTKDALRPLATDANPVVASVARSRLSESELKQIDAAFEKAVRSGRTAPSKADAAQPEKTGSGGKRHGFRRRGESSGESYGKRSYIPLTKETSDAIAVAFRRNLGIEPNDDPAGVKESVDKAAAYVKAEFKKLGMSDADISAHMGAFYDGVGDIVSGGAVAKESGKGEKKGNGKGTKSLRADKRETTKPTVSGSAANWTPPKAQTEATAKSKTRTNAKGQKTLKTEPVKTEPVKTEPVAPAPQKKRGQSEEAKSRVAAKKEADAKQREENAKKGKKKRSLKANQTVDLARLTTTGETDENGRPVLTEFGWALRDAQDALDVNKNNARGEERVPMSFAASNALTLSQLIGYANQLIERINKPTLSREEKEKIADANEREKYVTPEEREKAKQQLRRGDWSPERTKAFRTLKGKKKAGTATEEELNRERELARNTRRGVIPRIKALLGNDEAAHGVVERMFRGEDVTADLDAAVARWEKEAEDKNIIGYLRGGRTQRQRNRVRRLVDYEARRANETEEQRAKRLANRQELDDSRAQTDDGTAREEKPVQQRERYDTQDKIAEAPKNDVDKHVDGLLDNPQGNSLADIVTSIPQTKEVQRKDGTTTRQRARRVRGRAATVISGIHNPTTIRNLTLALESAVKANEKNLELGVQYAEWLRQARGRWQTLTGTVWGKSTAQDLQAHMEPYSPLGMDFGPKTKMGATTAIQLGENVARLSDEGTPAESVREAVDSGYTEDVWTHIRSYLMSLGIRTSTDQSDIIAKVGEAAKSNPEAAKTLRNLMAEYYNRPSGQTAAIMTPTRQSEADYNADDDTLDDTLDGHASSIGTLLLSRVADDYILPDGRTKRDVMAALRAAINRVGDRNWAQLTDEEKDSIYNDTGWEMRADGEWGYRVPPIMFNDDARERIEKAVLGGYREEMSIFDALDETSAQMLRAMDDTQIVELDDGATIPDSQFGDIKVIVRDLEPGDRNFGDSAWFDPINREIVITTSVLEGTTDDSALALDKIITHEMQHVIQEASEWSDRTPGRATSGTAYHNAMSEVDARAAERMVEQAYNDADAYEYGYAADVELEPSIRQEVFEDVPRSEQIYGRQKQADAVYPDASAEIKAMPEGNASSFRSLAMTTLQNKRPDLDANAVLDEVFKFPTAKERKISLHWIVRGGLALPQDAYKVADALSVAEKAKVDQFRYKSPDELLLANKDFKPSARPIDPATVPELSDARDEGDGIVSYLVQDDRQGQAAMRRIIDTHWGEDANPWCIVQRAKASKDPMGKAWKYWQQYSVLPKRAAFQNGRLLAFMATEAGMGKDKNEFSNPATQKRVSDLYNEFKKSEDGEYGNFSQWMMEEHPEEYDAIAEEEGDGGDAINLYQSRFVPEEWWDRMDESHPDLDWAKDGGNASSLRSLAGTGVGAAYGVTNRDILDRLRRALNDPTLNLPTNRTSMLAIFNEGSAILEETPMLADQLVTTAIDKMVKGEEWTPPSAAAYTILEREMLLRTLRRADAEAKLEEAANTGGDVTTAQTEKAEALAAEMEFAAALRNVKRTQAHELLMNKVLQLADYSYAGVIQSINDHLEKTGDSKLHPEQGRPLTAEEIKKYGIAQYVKKIAALEKKLADREKKLAEKNAQLEALGGARAAMTAGNKAKASGKRVYSVEEAKDRARKILAARMEDGGTFDPNDYAETWGAIQDLVKMIGDAIAFEYSQSGQENMSYEEFASALEAECNDVFQIYRKGDNASALLDQNYYRDLYAGIGRLDRIAPREQTKAEKEIARMQELTQRIAELERVRKGEPTPERYGKGPIALENVDKELAGVRSELNKLLRESGLSDASPHMKKTPLDRAKETLMRRILEIDDALERGVTLPGRENVALKRDAEEKFLREYRARLQALYDDLNGPSRSTTSDADRAANAIARLEELIARTQQEITDAESGLYDASKQSASTRRDLSSPDVSSLRAMLSDLRRVRDAARENADPVAAARLRLEHEIERQNNRRARFENAVREGVAKRPAQFSLNNTNDKEWVDAYFAAEKAKRELGRIKGKIAYDRKTLLGKAWATANSIKDTMRAYMASGDISGLGVQCAWYVLQHPRKAMKTIIPGLQAFFSEEKAIEVTRMIMSDPDFITMKEQMGVSFSLYGIESGYTQTEEAFARGEAASRLGAWADNKYLQMSERGFIVPINLCRFALAKEFLETMRDNRGENGHMSDDELRYLGRIVNIATGKGDFFGNAGASNFLSQILWAPSRVSSQIQILALPLTIWAHGEIGADLRRTILAKSVVKPLAHLAVMMVLLAMAGRMIRPDDDDEEIIGTDPTSSKFGKVKIGNRYMSLTGGLEQYITLLARTATGFKRDKKGKKIDLRGGFGRNIENEWLRWAKNKLRPDISMAWQFITGRDALGNELGPSMWGKNGYAYWFAKQGFIPITGGDIASAFGDVKTNGLPLSMIFAAMAFVGWNGSNFGETPYTKDLYHFGVAKEALEEGRNEAAVRNDPKYRRYLANEAALDANLKEQRKLEGLLKNGVSLGKDLRGNKKYRQLTPRETDEAKRRLEELQMDFHMACWPDVYKSQR